MISFLLITLTFALWAQDGQFNITLGHRTSFFQDEKYFDNSYLYYIPEYSSENIQEVISTRKKFKLRVFDPQSSTEKPIIDPLDISMEWFTDKNSFQVGFLRYRFSETFGLQLLDVANPRDYSEFIFNDLSWSKRSVFGFNNTYRFNDIEIQGIFTAWSNGDRLPYKNSTFDLASGQFGYQGGVIHRPWFKNPEYGLRFKKLFSNGLDLSFLYYHHFARPTPSQLIFSTFPLFPKAIKQLSEQVDSFGGAASYVLGDWVLRGDALYTINDIVQRELIYLTKPEGENHLQALLGVDRTFENFLIGLQTQSDFSLKRHFGGVRTEWSRFESWKPSIMYFRNYEISDEWLQIKNSFFWRDFRADIIWDQFQGAQKNQSLFALFRNSDRILFDVNYQY
jgi:hypothetical protein